MDDLEHSAVNSSVGAFANVERELFECKAAPLGGESRCTGFVDCDVNCPESIWVECAGVLDRTSRGAVDSVDENNHSVTTKNRCSGGQNCVTLEFCLLRLVLVVQTNDNPTKYGDDGDDHPRTVKELCGTDDDRDDACGQRARPIDS